MPQQPIFTKKRTVPWILGAVVLALLGFLILLQSSNIWKLFSVETASDTLLLYGLSSLNFAAFIIFGFIFLRNVIKLVRERRALALGSRIKTRLFLYFAAISLLPIIAMSGFSYLFMNRALERWFTQIPENVVRQARNVQIQAVADRAAEMGAAARMLATVVDQTEIDAATAQALADAGDLTRIEVVSADGQIIAAGGKTITDDSLKNELVRILDLARSRNVDASELSDGKSFDAAAADLSGDRRLIIVPDPKLDTNVGAIVDNSLAEFDRLKQQQTTVRQIGFLTLGVLTFLLIFASSWTAFYVARGLTQPIKALAEGADEIARGNYGHRVEVLAEDELAILVSSFNQMSARLELNAAAIVEGRRYIETILQSLPTGVISIDGDSRVTTINRAAIKILRLEDADFTGLKLSRLVNDDNRAVMEKLLARALRVGHAAEQGVLRRENVSGLTNRDSDLPVALIATALADGRGAVLVIEDLSELLAAQRAAAWQEVARRMAHEIKNPLTPIQLSAERIAKRFGPAAPAAVGIAHDAVAASSDPAMKIISEGTDTILREVRSLKALVDEFSRFARLPDACLAVGNLNDAVELAAATYGEHFDGVTIEKRLGRLPDSLLDVDQLKRVFINLIQNAIEASDANADSIGVVITTRFDHKNDVIIADVADNGKGIDQSDFSKLFQPYFSTKGRGTGLGLAIVARIIADHSGKIRAENIDPRGARFIIELPALSHEA